MKLGGGYRLIFFVLGPSACAHVIDEGDIKENAQLATPEQVEGNFLDLDLVSYSRHLQLHPLTSATPTRVSVNDERERYQELLKAEQMVMQAHSEMYKSENVPDLDHLAHVLKRKFYKCASLSPCPLWKGYCMAGLLGDARMKMAVPRLIKDFRTQNVEHFLFASIMVKDMELLGMLAQEYDLSAKERWGCAMVAVAVKGSIPLLEKVTKHIPLNIDKVRVIAIFAAALGHESLFTAALNEADQEPDTMIKMKVLRKILVRACVIGSDEIAKSVIEKYSKGILQDKDYLKGLLKAARLGNLSMIKICLNSNQAVIENIEQVIEEIITIAAQYDCFNILEYLFLDWHNRQQVNLRDTIPTTVALALIYTSSGTIKLLPSGDGHGRFLLSDEVLRQNFRFIFDKILRAGRADLMELLLSRDSSQFAHIRWFDDQTPLQVACSWGHVEIVRLFLRMDKDRNYLWPGVDPGANANQALCAACRCGDMNIVKELLRRDVDGALVHRTIDPGFSDNAPLQCAVLNERVEVVRFLLQQRIGEAGKLCYVYEGIDPAAGEQAILREAVRSENIQLINFLLKTDDNDIPIHPMVVIPPGLLRDATRWGKYRAVHALLCYGFEEGTNEISLALEAAMASDANHPIIDLLQSGLQENAAN